MFILLIKNLAPYTWARVAAPTFHRKAIIPPVSLNSAQTEIQTESTERKGFCSACRPGELCALPRFLPKTIQTFPNTGAKKDTFHQKVSESAPVKLSRCKFFCSNQTLFVSSYPNQNKTGKNNLLTDDTFFSLKLSAFFTLFLSHFRVIEIATDIRKQLCCTHPTTMPQLHKSLPASLWKDET